MCRVFDSIAAAVALYIILKVTRTCYKINVVFEKFLVAMEAVAMIETCKRHAQEAHEPSRHRPPQPNPPTPSLPHDTRNPPCLLFVLLPIHNNTRRRQTGTFSVSTYLPACLVIYIHSRLCTTSCMTAVTSAKQVHKPQNTCIHNIHYH